MTEFSTFSFFGPQMMTQVLKSSSLAYNPTFPILFSDDAC